MNLDEILLFFNSYAKDLANEPFDCFYIDEVLDASGIQPGESVCDCACGTGNLIPVLLNRKVGQIDGYDLSPKMIEIATARYPQKNISFHVQNIEEGLPTSQYNRIYLYNAYPHIMNPEKMIQTMFHALKEKGTFTIVHGASRKVINECHANVTSISNELPSAEEIAKIMVPYFEITACVDTNKSFYLVGKKKERVS